MWADNMDMLLDLDDMLNDQQIELMECINARTWITNTGDRIPFEQITDSHLNNIIRRGESLGNQAYFGMWDEIKEALYAEQERRST